MAELAFEDLTSGRRFEGGPVVLSRDELLEFARAYDPQVFHLDEAAARGTFAGTLIASGWQTCALGMRAFAEGFLLRTTSMGSPGIDEVRWLRPVLPGDALGATIEVRQSRASASKPDRGFVQLFMTLANQRGEAVMTQDFWVMFGRRGAAALPPSEAPARLADDGPVTTQGPEPASPTPFFDDVAPGMTRDLGTYRLDAEELLRFGRAYDPQPFHVDEEAGRRSHFGGLIASGWQTAALWMNRMMAQRTREAEAAAAAGVVTPEFGPSPGFKAMRWLKPVYAGDGLRFTTTVTDRRASTSRPGWGLVFQHNTADNQRGERVFEFQGCVFWQRRP